MIELTAGGGGVQSTTVVYNETGATSPDRYLLVELSYTVAGDTYPDPLLMVAYEKVPTLSEHPSPHPFRASPVV